MQGFFSLFRQPDPIAFCMHIFRNDDGTFSEMPAPPDYFTVRTGDTLKLDEAPTPPTIAAIRTQLQHWVVYANRAGKAMDEAATGPMEDQLGVSRLRPGQVWILYDADHCVEAILCMNEDNAVITLKLAYYSIGSMVVCPDRQRQGVGGEFFEYVFQKHAQFAGTPQCPQVGMALASLPDTVPFWEKRGFKQVPRPDNSTLVNMLRHF